MWPVINSIPFIGWNYSTHTGENISANESTRFITGHMVYNLAYTLILQMTTTNIIVEWQI